jgi:hypothetical protein
MSVSCITEANAKTVLITYGTQYHVGKDEDFEKVVAEKLPCDVHIEGHAFPKINGVQIDAKHHIGSASVPQGKYTAMARDKMWNTIWSSRDEQQPEAGILIRSHVHSFNYCGNSEWLAVTTPGLQGYGSLFGTRRCSGTIDIGMLSFDIEDNGRYTWSSHLAKLRQQYVKPLMF